MSLRSSSRCFPELQMSRRYSSCRSLISPNMRSSKTSENPMTALSGVRSSCDMLARNSDLCWLATVSSALLRASSRNSRAFMMARADWLANVTSRSRVSSLNVPGVFRLTTSAPTIVPLRSMGTMATERQPASCSRRRWASSGAALRSGTCWGVPVVAARPTSVSRQSDRGLPQGLDELGAGAVRRCVLGTSDPFHRTRKSSRRRCRTAARLA